MRRSPWLLLSPLVGVVTLAACDSGSADMSWADGWNATGHPPTMIPAATTLDVADRADLPAAPADLEFFADYSRYLWHQRRLVVATTNTGDDPVEVTAIALRSGHFEWLPAEAKSTTIVPDARVDVQVDFGPLVSCDVEPLGPTAAAVTLATGGGAPSTYLADFDPAPLNEIRERECARRRVTDAADITFGADLVVDGTTMRTTIDIDRTSGSETIRLDSLQGSVIIALHPVDDTELVTTLDHERSTASVPVELFIARCEPHAVSQSTLTWVLSAFVSIGDHRPHKFQLELPAAMRAALQQMIDECIATLPADD